MKTALTFRKPSALFRRYRILGGAGDDIIEVIDLAGKVSGSCGPGHDVFRAGGPYTPEDPRFINRQWGKDRWAVRVADGYRHILAECEAIEFTDGKVVQIPPAH